jgi:hypothetical protein
MKKKSAGSGRIASGVTGGGCERCTMDKIISSSSSIVS